MRIPKPMPTLTSWELVRFHQQVQYRRGCQPWRGELASSGYGLFMIYRDGRRHRFLAHRIAYHLATGEDPGELCVRHRCDNPPCCNPADLLTGTQAENIADAVARGRLVEPPHPRGDAHPRAKLTSSTVAVLRARYAAGGISQRALAAEYGVAQSTVRSAITGQCWSAVAS